MNITFLPSDVSVQSDGKLLTCRACKLSKHGGGFRVATAEEMYKHLLRHVEAGHHVPQLERYKGKA